MKNPINLLKYLFFLAFLIQGCDKSKNDWGNAKRVNTIESYNFFLLKHSKSTFADSANQLIEILKWEKTLNDSTIEAYQKFLIEYPQSKYADSIKREIEELIWNLVLKENTMEGFQKFIEDNPKNKFVISAKEKIAEIKIQENIKVTTSIPLKEQINDDAIMKLTIIDKAYNFIGEDWLDRDKYGYGKKVILKLQTRIALKYGYTSIENCLSEYESSDLPEQIEGDGGNMDGGYGSIYLKDAINYYQLIRWKDKSKLPSISYRNGEITLNYSSGSVLFSEGLECLIGSKEYAYINGTWQQQ